MLQMDEKWVEVEERVVTMIARVEGDWGVTSSVRTTAHTQVRTQSKYTLTVKSSWVVEDTNSRDFFQIKHSLQTYDEIGGERMFLKWGMLTSLFRFL